MPFICIEFKRQTVLFNQLNRTVPGASPLGQSGRGSNDNEVVLHIP